jgi:hypothetical protein
MSAERTLRLSVLLPFRKASSARIRKEMEDSLHRLCVDVIDIC